MHRENRITTIPEYNEERLPAFTQVDIRIDKTFYLKRCMLGFYIDLQNIAGSKLKQADVLMSTGVIKNPDAPIAEQRYVMKSPQARKRYTAADFGNHV